MVLERYRHLSDPVSYALAQRVYEAVRLEAESLDEMSAQEAEAYVCRVRSFTRALADAVREWRSGLVP